MKTNWDWAETESLIRWRDANLNERGRMSFRRLETDPETTMFGLFAAAISVVVFLIVNLSAYALEAEWSTAHWIVLGVLEFIPAGFTAAFFFGWCIGKYNAWRKHQSLVAEINRRSA